MVVRIRRVALALKFIDHRGDPAAKHLWTPFASSIGYEHPDWWSNAGGAVGDPWFVEVLEDGVEVARVKLDERGHIHKEYAGAPAIDSSDLLEIQNIEVNTATRRRKVATQVVQGLVERNPDRRLMAYSSADAEEFWNSLVDWKRFDRAGRGPRSSPLFIQGL
jgi:hypothetical protein